MKDFIQRNLLEAESAPTIPSSYAQDPERLQWLGFFRERATAWFHPVAMARTAFRVVFAKAIAAYTDRRESMVTRGSASLGETILGRLQEKGEVWVDYVADTGDGFSATYTTAVALGSSKLRVRGHEGKLPRADVLVLGGDCVYPTPGIDRYKNHLIGPMTFALPQPEASVEPPAIVCIPGNHDWYDGLTAFLFTFCSDRNVGGWKTYQNRSYFSLRLPGGWQLWGNDVQLESHIDREQLRFFEGELALSDKPAKVILCTASPYWLSSRGAPSRFRNGWYFEHRMAQRGGVFKVSLSGDLHCYARYVSTEGSHRFIAGAGGSYLQGTHQLPLEARPLTGEEDFLGLDQNRSRQAATQVFKEAGSAFPSRKESRRLARGALLFPLLGHNWAFCLFLGVMNFLMAWGLRFRETRYPAVKPIEPATNLADPGAFNPFEHGQLADFLKNLLDRYGSSPSHLLWPVLLVASLSAFCRVANGRSRRFSKISWGFVHGLAQLAAGIAAIWIVGLALAEFAEDRWWHEGALDLSSFPESVVYLAANVSLVLLSGFLAGSLMGIYLFLSDWWFGWHTRELFSAQGIRHFRCFLRMRIESNGRLTIYPIGIRWTPMKWLLRPDRQRGESLYVPANDPLEPELIEEPIVVEA